ncbi:MAG: YbaN family protein [bacterium]|nr:YbaN family protein [bacterium]
MNIREVARQNGGICINPLKKTALVVLGSISLFLGILGIFLPLLPTTPFLLFTATCFTKSSPYLYSKLMSLKGIGPYIQNYQKSGAVPLKTKIYAVTLLWLSIGATSIFAVHFALVKLLLFAIACLVTWHIYRLPTQIRKP